MHLTKNSKLSFGKYSGGLLGNKIIGFIYSECLDVTIYGIAIWNRGLFLRVKGKQQ